MVILRIASFISLLLAAVFLPWPVAAGLAAVFMAAFSWFWEAAIVGFLLGSIYGFSGGSLFFAFFVSSFVASLLVEEYFKNLFQGKNIISYVIIFFSGGAAIVLFWLAFKLMLYV